MFRATLLLCFSSLVAARTSGADAVPGPTPLPASRYAAMREKSPFAPATAAGPVASSDGTFAANWFVGGIGRYGDADFVTIKSRDLTVQFTLFGNEIHPQHHVSISSVNWSDGVGESTVILQKGTETAKLEFNQVLLRSQQTTAGTRPSPAGTPQAHPIAATPDPALSNTVAMSPPPAKGLANDGAPRNPGIVQRRVQIIAQPR